MARKKAQKLDTIAADLLEFYDAPRLIWIRVSDAVGMLWDENPKLHDIGSLVVSFQKHGFQEIPKFDINLSNVSGGTGAIKAGNGRVEVLEIMEKNVEAMGYEIPRGLAVEKSSGAWVMPLLVGTDAMSMQLAQSYAIDSNNLTMTGGDLTVFDIAQVWNQEGYIKILESLSKSGTSLASIDADDIDLLIRAGKGFGDMKDFTLADEDELKIGAGISFRVIVEEADFFADVIEKVRELFTKNEQWQARIE